MIHLLLQKDFTPKDADMCALAETFTFSGGEEHVIMPKSVFGSHVTIASRINNSSDLMKVILAKDALDRIVSHVSLFIPYIPYGRQDRVMKEGEPLSIKVFARLINSCGFQFVKTLDPHSDVTGAVIDNLHIVPTNEFVLDAIKRDMADFESENEVCLVAPDAGAEKRVLKIHEALQLTCDIVNCGKTRNGNREITDTRIYGDVKEKDCYIVDDICDGGRTFAALAIKLKEAGAKRVVLIVTHGIFSYGEEQLKDIDHIYSTNSWKSYKSDLITFINI